MTKCWRIQKSCYDLSCFSTEFAKSSWQFDGIKFNQIGKDLIIMISVSGLDLGTNEGFLQGWALNAAIFFNGG